MKTEHRYYLSISIGLLVLGLLIFGTIETRPAFGNPIVFIVFLFLIVFTTMFGVPFGGGTVSFLPMSILATFLVLGLIPAGWGAFLGALLHQGVRQLFGDHFGIPKVPSKLGAVAVAFANAGMQSISILAGGWVYGLTNRMLPFSELSLQSLAALLLLVLGYMVANLFLAGGFMYARGKAALQMYIRSLPNLVLYEIAPLVFLPLLPLVYTRLGFGIFILLNLAIVAASLIARNLALTSRGLERRVQELDSLQAVGQALSSSLYLDEILSAVYEQVATLMPVHNFYVALYFQEEDEVSFPLVVEGDQKVKWKSRQAGSGLTEYLLRRKEPLLISSNVEATLKEIDIEHIGTPAASWLGVPMVSGNNPLGVIAVQSYTATELYDEHHKDILGTIAAQAAVAIQNARLYEQTDEALSRRVQELNSILRTSAEGMLMLNLDFRILAANRALANFLETPMADLSGGDWGSIQLAESVILLKRLGYTLETLGAECQVLMTGGRREKKRVIKIVGPPERHLERTLSPVMDSQDEIAGWLLVLRDISEEIKLARLREDMAHMLVHDLRSPLTVLRGSFGILRKDLEDGLVREQTLSLVEMAERSTERMMSMVDGLLDIAKLEDGQMPLYTEAVPIGELFSDVMYRVSQLAKEANIKINVSPPDDLPDLRADPKHIRRVLGNILDNAIKFTPDDGEVKLWAELDEAAYPATMLLCVSDTGPGISAQAQKKIFKKFQTDSKTHGRRKGTGLGLAYCKLVVEAHGGEIWVESKQGKGSTFIARLPVDHL
ncbi:MAG: GAF domain-containing protein [Anaerolineales bacterium]|nr:GAF domain-containing protein [Chloroflexota bacterium]MBL6982184.1 GAF domain-containing protein [Anaerolineales bacterium]